MSPDIIKQRIEGRRHAEQMIELVGVNDMAPHVKHGFYMAIVAMAKELYPPREVLSTMSHVEVKAFEQTVIQFGVHKGKTFGEVPREYLEWVADQTLQIQRYLRNAT